MCVTRSRETSDWMRWILELEARESYVGTSCSRVVRVLSGALDGSVLGGLLARLMRVCETILRRKIIIEGAENRGLRIASGAGRA